MRRSRTLLGLPALSLAAACASVGPGAPAPLPDRTAQARCPAREEPSAPAAGAPRARPLLRPAAAPEPAVSVARPLTDADRRPACGNVMSKKSGPPPTEAKRTDSPVAP
jgi:hypothetical protein